MANSMIMNDSAPVAGLGTTSYTCTAADAGFVSVEVKTTIPLNSALSIAIKLNTVTQVSVGGVVTNPTPTQQSMGAGVKLQCVANDVIDVVLTSLSIADNARNAVKSVINLYQGK